MAKTIHECNDGRGCRYSPEGSQECRQQGKRTYIVSTFPVINLGCDGYEEKPPESTPPKLTLKDRIERHKPSFTLLSGTSNYADWKALLRDIVYYAYLQGWLERCVPNGENILDKIYKELGIEE